ncbi:MAG: hypothetical protein ABR529_05315 [Actinomycetota bacterium]
MNVIELGPEMVAAISTSDPIEIRGFTQLERRPDLDRDIPGPALEVPEIVAVEEDAAQERIGGDLFGALRRYGTDAGDLAHLSRLHLLPSTLGH